MDLFLDPEATKPLTGQLYEQLRHAITTGRLLPGDQLVPSRQLAGELGVSRHTVTTAYGRLVAEGYAEGHGGGGSVVATAVAAEHREYGDPAGKIRLRRAIADWVARSRSVAAAEDTVVITCGAQHAIDLVARVLLEPGDCVAVEDPGYVPVVRLFGTLGARVVGVPVDDQGLVVDLLPPSARIVYVTPSHQYPLGMTMSMPRRRALLRWAERHDAAVIEDDYDTEFRYVDRPLEPLQALDVNGRVVYVGSFSKTFSPSVRLGFTVVPRPLFEPIAALRQLIDWHPPTAMQTALASFINDGLLDKHIRRNRRIYAERHHILIEALSGPLADHLTARAVGVGLHVAAVLREGLRENAVLQAAARHGIVTSGLHDCYQTVPAQSGLLIGFGAVSTTGLSAALRTLARILASQPRAEARGVEPGTG